MYFSKLWHVPIDEHVLPVYNVKVNCYDYYDVRTSEYDKKKKKPR